MLEWVVLGEIKLSAAEAFTQKTPMWKGLEELLDLHGMWNLVVKKSLA